VEKGAPLVVAVLEHRPTTKGVYMSLLRDRMARDMERAGLAACTRKEYIAAIRHMVAFLRREPEALSVDDVRDWIDEMHRRGRGPDWIRVHNAAMAFLFRKTMGRPELVSFLSYPRRPRRLPTPISVEEVARVLSLIQNAQYRVFFSLIYDTGLRLAEAAGLHAFDIDHPRGVIHVRGKGQQERLVKLGDTLYQMLRAYWRETRVALPILESSPQDARLFVSATGHRINYGTARAALAKAGEEAGVARRVTPHILRHSFATHQVEADTNLRVIQTQLGHASIHTTQIYTRVSTQLLLRAPSPLDTWLRH